MADMGLAIWVGDDGSEVPIGPVVSKVINGQRQFGNVRTATIGVGPLHVPFNDLQAIAQQSHNTNVDTLDVELSILLHQNGQAGGNGLDPIAVAARLGVNVNTVISRLGAQNSLNTAFTQLGGVDAVPQQQLPTLINLAEQLASDPEVDFRFTGVREDTQALVGNLVIAGRVVDFAGATAVELIPVVGTGFAVIRDPADPTNILGALPFLGAVGVMARGGRNADDIFRNGREIARLARDPARGGERSLREGVAGLKLQRILGRRVERSTVRETDFVFRNDAGIEQTVSLKGPFLPAAVDERALLRGQGQNLVDAGFQSVDDLTQSVIRKFSTDLNDVKVIDLFGLSPSQRRQFVSGLESGLSDDAFNAIIFLDN